MNVKKSKRVSLGMGDPRELPYLKRLLCMKDLYDKSHLVLAAVRVLEHRHQEPPSVEKVCNLLALSLEQGHLICQKLQGMAALEMVDGPYGNRLFIRDHLKVEEIPRDGKETSLQEELERFQNSRKKFTDEIESFQARKQKEKQKLFSDIEEKLKKRKEK